MLYKEKGNGIYGHFCRVISNKMNFDSLTKKTFRVTATNLYNPILASWTTAFIRSVIGECLHNIKKLGGKVVSVTSDGFITDIENLEDKLWTLPQLFSYVFSPFCKLTAQRGVARELKLSFFFLSLF